MRRHSGCRRRRKLVRELDLLVCGILRRVHVVVALGLVLRVIYLV